MKFLPKIIIFCWIKLITSYTLRNEESTSDLHSMNNINIRGNNDFICLNEKNFKFCRDGLQCNDHVFECKPGFVCDENNDQFCSPIKSLQRKEKLQEKDADYINPENDNDSDNFMFLKRLASLNNNELEDYDEFLSNLIEMLKTNENSENQDNLQNKQMDQNLTCEENQFLPDRGNAKMFYYCFKKMNGEVELLHMFCGINQIYDPHMKACRNLKSDDASNTDATVKHSNDQSLTNIDDSRFKAQYSPKLLRHNQNGKTSQKVKDDHDCHLYHMIFDDNYIPLKEMTFICPENTAFDPQCQTCTKLAVTKYCPPQNKSCSSAAIKTNNNKSSYNIPSINKLNFASDITSTKTLKSLKCQIPFVFREISDCSFYYVCRDDKIYKMLCPPSFLFDDFNLTCMPQNVSHCIQL